MNSPSSLPLALFPPDVLTLIANYLEGDAICRIVCCGHSVLTNRLTALSCVQSFTLIDHNWHRAPLNLPFVTQFNGIESISLVFDPSSCCLPYLWQEPLFALPSTLKSVHFAFGDAEECWKRLSPRDVSQTKLPYAALASFDFQLRLPNLRRLILTSQIRNSHYVVGHGLEAQLRALVFNGFHDADISLLPPSLTHLELTWCYNLTKEGVSHLPTSLTTLKLPFQYIMVPEMIEPLHSCLELRYLSISSFINLTTTACTFFPPNLEVLEVRGASALGDGLRYIPRNSTSLHLPYEPLTSVAIAQLLPSALTDLRVGPVTSEVLQAKALPMTLTRLHIEKLEITSTDDFFHFRYLSRLTSLYLGANSSDELEPMEGDWLPPKLTTLGLVPLQLIPWRHLPQSIVQIETDTIESFSMIPTHVQTLETEFEETHIKYHRYPDWKTSSPPLTEWISIHDVAGLTSDAMLNWMNPELVEIDTVHPIRRKTPLDISLKSGNIGTVKWLLDHGASLTYSKRILVRLVDQKKPILEWLFSRYTDAMISISRAKLQQWWMSGTLSDWEWILKQGLIEIVIPQINALHSISSCSWVTLDHLNWLESHQLIDPADYDMIEPGGTYSPLMELTMQRKLDCAKWLFARGATLFHVSRSGFTLAHLVFHNPPTSNKSSSALEFLQWLHEGGVDVLAPTQRGLTPLQLCKRQFNPEAESWLLSLSSSTRR